MTAPLPLTLHVEVPEQDDPQVFVFTVVRDTPYTPVTIVHPCQPEED